WGHRIPAWYDADGQVVVAATEKEAMQLYETQFGKPATALKQDEDCLDTWFSSWLWPFEVFKGYSNPGNAEIKYYYPTNTLVTAPEIIFFWVARMIMAGYEYMDAKPFETVYFTGIVRDKLGRKMSKSLGNSPDLLALIDQYGTDAVRFGIMIASPAGNDILFDEAALEQGRNFNNKMWNALKLVKLWESKLDANYENKQNGFALRWFRNRLDEARIEINQMMDQFRLSEALKTLYSLIWDDFCSWYLEWVKPGMEQPMDAHTYQSTIDYFTELMEMLHPFMPFITEEIYQHLENRNKDLCVRQVKTSSAPNPSIILQGRLLQDLISGIRDVRNRQQIKPRESIKLFIQTKDREPYGSISSILYRQVNAEEISFCEEAVAGSYNTVIGKDSFYIVSEQPIDSGSQKESLEKELAHLKGFLLSIEKKLGNEKFMANAKPEVVALEQMKKSDAETKIKVIEESLAIL
ncbi:MAG TPA: valine--tRNA ligase, partial [Chitinophagaceae bacterium]|nr:valine--tRNA ligase [Chitinophagaceae bacterium]